MRDISARELKGHNILAVERFQDSTRWMIEVPVRKPVSHRGRVSGRLTQPAAPGDQNQKVRPCD